MSWASQRGNTRLWTELGMAVALAVVLDLISKSLPLPRMPYGGSISLRGIPIVVVALRHGYRAGALAGIASGFVELLMGAFYVHPIQILMDYPVAFGALGLAGLAGPIETTTGIKPRLQIALAACIGGVARFAAHFASGLVFWRAYAPEGQPVWLYSLLYNGSYILPEIIITILLLQWIIAVVKKKEL